MSRIAQLEKMLAEDPNDSFVQFAMAMEYKSNEDFENAIEQFEKLKLSDADYVGLYYHLAKSYEEQGDEKKALTIYSTGITIATKLNDLHAKSELMNEKMNLELGL